MPNEISIWAYVAGVALMLIVAVVGYVIGRADGKAAMPAEPSFDFDPMSLDLAQRMTLTNAIDILKTTLRKKDMDSSEADRRVGAAVVMLKLLLEKDED